MLTNTLLLYLQGISTVQIPDFCTNSWFLYKYLIFYKYLISVQIPYINTDAIIHAGSGLSLDLVVEPYATQLSTIWVKLLIVS